MIVKDNKDYICSIDCFGQKWTDALSDLGDKIFINKNKATQKLIHMVNDKETTYMKCNRQVVDDRAFEKNYNIEWYLGNGKIRTTSAVMTSIENGYIFFRYPSGGIFILKDDVIRSLECME